jgi:integrase
VSKVIPVTRQVLRGGDAAWRRVPPFRNVEAPVIRFLTTEEALRLVNASDVEFRPWCGRRFSRGAGMASSAGLKCPTSIMRTPRSRSGTARAGGRGMCVSRRRARSSGGPLQVVASALGHADARMTEKHYAHLAPSHVALLIRDNLPPLSPDAARKPRKVRRLRG